MHQSLHSGVLNIAAETAARAMSSREEILLDADSVVSVFCTRLEPRDVSDDLLYEHAIFSQRN